MSARLIPPADLLYPSSDGKPMAETDVHCDWMVRLIELLKFFFAGRRVYVSGNLLVYYEEGNPKRSFAPDVFVVKDRDPGRRRIYKIWEEGKPPDFILETTSKKTRKEDSGTKKKLYAQLGIAEYFLYDPLAEWLAPPLRGFRLVDGEYVPLEPDQTGGIVSEQLGLTFRLENGELVLFVTETGERLKTGDERAAEAESQAHQAESQAHEAELRAREAESRAAQEAASRQALEEELARLRAERG